MDIAHILPNGNSQHMQIAIGRYSDGKIGEVFIDYPTDKQKQPDSYLGKDAATIVSIALQYGVPLEVMRDAMGRGDVNYMGKTVTLPHTVIGTVLDRMSEE